MSEIDSREPAVRARSARDWLEYLEVREPKLAARVVCAIPSVSREAILGTPRTGWIPVEHDRYLPRATVEVFGETRAIALWSEFLPSHLDAPLFRTLVTSMVRLFGLTPSTFVRLLPRAWGQSCRDCCEVEIVEMGAQQARAAFVNCHPDVIGWPSYMISWKGVMQGAFALTQTSGELDMQVDVAGRRIELRWTWSG